MPGGAQHAHRCVDFVGRQRVERVRQSRRIEHHQQQQRSRQQRTPQITARQISPAPRAALAVRAAPEVLERFAPDKGAVAIILDCSGSMLRSELLDKSRPYKGKVYRNEQYGFEFRYPGDMRISSSIDHYVTPWSDYVIDIVLIKYAPYGSSITEIDVGISVGTGLTEESCNFPDDSYRQDTRLNGFLETEENVNCAFGHGHKGLGTGPITGKLVQQLMDGQPTTIDVAPFSPARFG